MRNVKKLVDNFEGRMEVKVRQQMRVKKKGKKKIEREKYRRMKLLRKYTAKLLYRWDDRKFKDEYLKKLEKN